MIASGQDGAVYMWNADNGALEHVYDKPLGPVMVDNSPVVVNRLLLGCGSSIKNDSFF